MLKIKRLEKPAFNYKAVIEEDLEKIRSYVKLDHFCESTALKIETDKFGYIVLLQRGEVVGLISNKNISLIEKQQKKDCSVDTNEVAEALLYKVISETLPANLIFDYLPTLLIFLELSGLNFDNIDFNLWENKYLNNQFCLCSGLKIEKTGNLFAYETGTEAEADECANNGKKKSKSFYTQFTAKSGSKIKGIKPGILVYREIIKYVDSILRPQESVQHYVPGIYNALKNYCADSISLLSSISNVSEGYTPRDLNPMDKSYICSNVDKLIDDDLIMIFNKGRPKVIIDYYQLLKKVNMNRQSLEKRDLTLENYLVNINQFKKIILENLKYS